MSLDFFFTLVLGNIISMNYEIIIARDLCSGESMRQLEYIMSIQRKHIINDTLSFLFAALKRCRSASPT